MKYIFTLLLTAGLIFNSNAQAELSLAKHVRMAEALKQEGKFADAAYHYEQAWLKKTKKTDLIFQAAECYYTIRDFRKAIEAYKHVKDNTTDYPLAGLKYARCLKQDCQYDAASREFVYFINTYTGPDKDKLGNIVQNDIRGCELGIQLTENKEAMGAKIEHLSENINSPLTEFAPAPFNDDILYFSSTMGGKAKIYRSQYKGGEWTKAEEPKGFPNLQDVHFGNGAFAPDASRFYFTQCVEVSGEEGIRSRCQIFMIKRNASGWTDPLRLRDYINVAGSTTTQPCIAHRDGKEYLYFVSDREGGLGGLDIWYAVRELISDDIDFTLPVNAGTAINTAGDEITPWYDAEAGALYFSSNGKITIGGYDAFMAPGSGSKWEAAENIGLPYNSCADDFYYCMNKSRSGGFIVSNRMFGMEKVTTSNEDIFTFTFPELHIMASGKIYDKTTSKLVEETKVTLYERLANGEKRLLNTTTSKDGNYMFELLPARKMRIEINKAGYLIAAYDFETVNTKITDFGQPIYLEKAVTKPETPVTKPPVSPPAKPAEKPVVTKPTATATVNTAPLPGTAKPVEQKVSTGELRDMKPATEPYTLRTAAPVLEGTYYKIQLVATKVFDSNQSNFKTIASLGRYDTEYIVGKDITRVLIGDFLTFEAATKALSKAKGSFKDAYIVRYQDGVRMGIGK
jgi:hypothetical protein